MYKATVEYIIYCKCFHERFVVIFKMIHLFYRNIPSIIIDLNNKKYKCMFC